MNRENMRALREGETCEIFRIVPMVVHPPKDLLYVGWTDRASSEYENLVQKQTIVHPMFYSEERDGILTTSGIEK